MTTDTVTANLPSRSLDATSDFYSKLGFENIYQDDDWMILGRGDLIIEFFSFPDLDPDSSSFSACVRVAEVDALHAAWSDAKLGREGIPRQSELSDAPWGMRSFHLVDLDGSLLRVMEPIT